MAVTEVTSLYLRIQKPNEEHTVYSHTSPSMVIIVYFSDLCKVQVICIPCNKITACAITFLCFVCISSFIWSGHLSGCVCKVSFDDLINSNKKGKHECSQVDVEHSFNSFVYCAISHHLVLNF